MNIYVLNIYAYVKKLDTKILFYVKLITEPVGSPISQPVSIERQ
jgi:hypothetical protein